MGLEDTKKVNSCRARGNTHKLFIRKKNFYHESDQILEELPREAVISSASEMFSNQMDMSLCNLI